MPREHTQSEATHFLSSFSLISSLLTHLCPFLCSIILFMLSYHLFIFLPLTLPVSPCLMQVISPSWANLAVIDPLIFSALECLRNKTVVLTTPIKQMEVIKNHTCIICAIDISNGEQVISDGSHFLNLSLPHTNTNNARIHTAEKVKSI